MPLELNKNIFATKGIDQKSRAVFCLLGSTDCQPVASGSLPDALGFYTRGMERCLRQAATNYRLAACAPRPKERHQTFRELRQLIPTHCALSFFAAQMRLGQQLTQIFVTRAVLNQDRQNTAVFHG